ncbi:MAG: hypothetical protein U1E83_03135 [Methylotetracoccus sp.]
MNTYSFQFTVCRSPNPEPRVHFGGIFSTERAAREALARFVELLEADPVARVTETQVFQVDRAAQLGRFICPPPDPDPLA